MIDAPHAAQSSRPRVALAHDWLVGMRGGERVLDRLARLFGPTELYTLVHDGRPLTEAIDGCRIITSPLQAFPGARGRLRRHYLPLMPWAVNQLRIPRGSCDVLISTSSAVMKSIMPPLRVGSSQRVPHLCYCHSPARYVWDLTDDYSRGAGGLLRGIGLGAVRRRFQQWDRRTAGRVSQFLANSTFTAQRIRQFYERDAAVVHPPVRTDFFTPDSTVAREEFLLVVSALEPYKRVDVVIDAANRGRLPLTVIGDGSQRRALEAFAGNTVRFLGRATDEVVRDHYRRARALVFPQVEDFGIVAAEAQACGCPVIAFEKGGAADIVIADTGEFIREQSASAILEALAHIERIDPERCVANAQRFGEERFDREILEWVNRLVTSPET